MRVLDSVPEQLLPDHVPDDVAEEEGGVRRDRVPGRAGGGGGAVDGEVDHLHSLAVRD